MTHIPGTLDRGPGSLGIAQPENIIVDFFDPNIGFFEPTVGQQAGIMALQPSGARVRELKPILIPQGVRVIPESAIPSVPSLRVCPNTIRPDSVFSGGVLRPEPPTQMIDSQSLSFIGIAVVIVFGILAIGS